jgi:hypothetical protein
VARVLVLALALTAPLVAGCVAPAQLAPAGLDAGPVADVLKLLDGGGFEVRVPVHLALMGFEPGTSAALQSALEPERIEHLASSAALNLPPDPAAATASGLLPLPVIPTAVYVVHEMPAAFTDVTLARVAASRMGDAAGAVFDGNVLEDWLATELPGQGVPLDTDTPALVFLHAGGGLPEGHAYRYSYLGGYVEPVRLVGERAPLLVMDVSAAADPYVVARPPSPEGIAFGTVFGRAEPQAFDRPLARGGADVVEVLREAAVEATNYRLLQGSLYPPTTLPCHAITLILGVRGAALTEVLPGYTRAQGAVDAASLDRAWENITGRGTVEVDVRVLRMPLDDPVLDAVSRGGLGTLDALRFWLDANWQRYWVAHEGCEPYVSFLVYGDAADADSFGIATYDVQRSHRVSFAVVNEATRVRDEWRGPAADLAGTRDASRAKMDWVNLFFAHETGHLIGQQHTHNIQRAGSDLPGTRWSFSSVWSAMSYQTDDKTLDFGAVDRANYHRNRAGYLLQAAQAEGLEGSTVWKGATQALAAYRWAEAGRLLEAALKPAS